MFHSSLILCVLGSMAHFLVGLSEGLCGMNDSLNVGVFAKTFMLDVSLKLQDECLSCDTISYNCQCLHH